MIAGAANENTILACPFLFTLLSRLKPQLAQAQLIIQSKPQSSLLSFSPLTPSFLRRFRFEDMESTLAVLRHCLQLTLVNSYKMSSSLSLPTTSNNLV